MRKGLFNALVLLLVIVLALACAFVAGSIS